MSLSPGSRDIVFFYSSSFNNQSFYARLFVSAVLVQVLATVMASASFIALARFFNYTAAALPLG